MWDIEPETYASNAKKHIRIRFKTIPQMAL